MLTKGIIKLQIFFLAHFFFINFLYLKNVMNQRCSIHYQNLLKLEEIPVIKGVISYVKSRFLIRHCFSINYTVLKKKGVIVKQILCTIFIQISHKLTLIFFLFHVMYTKKYVFLSFWLPLEIIGIDYDVQKV